VRGAFEFLRGRLNLLENAAGQRRFRRLTASTGFMSDSDSLSRLSASNFSI
jgi:hypothetical protein